MQKQLITKGDATSALIKLKDEFLREAVDHPDEKAYYHGISYGLSCAVSELLEVPATKIMVLDDKTKELLEIRDSESTNRIDFISYVLVKHRDSKKVYYCGSPFKGCDQDSEHIADAFVLYPYDINTDWVEELLERGWTLCQISK